MDVLYASHFGHTGQIAQRLAQLISVAGVPARACDLARDYPSAERIHSPDPCVLISAIRYGVHLPRARRLLRQIAPLTPQKPLILLSVNLTARKQGKSSATGNLYLRKWISRTGARPLLAEAIAGNLDYPRYNVFDRTMIRLIMNMTGGPSDGTSVIDYTPWDHLPELADRICAAIALRGPGAPAA
jgi:menaquinone-dependent protoporphyrinogen oxidase